MYTVYFNLIQSLHSSHGGLDMKTLHVLPVLLQQRDQEVHCQMDVLSKLLLVHIDMANRNIETQNLLHLEFDGWFQVHYLGLQVICVGDKGWKFASLQNSNVR